MNILDAKQPVETSDLYKTAIEMTQLFLRATKSFPQQFKIVFAQSMLATCKDILQAITKGYMLTDDLHAKAQCIKEITMPTCSLLADLRIAYSLGILSKENYAHLADLCVSIRKQTNAWLRYTNKQIG